jgi:hypothetical protein
MGLQMLLLEDWKSCERTIAPAPGRSRRKACMLNISRYGMNQYETNGRVVEGVIYLSNNLQVPSRQAFAFSASIAPLT